MNKPFAAAFALWATKLQAGEAMNGPDAATSSPEEYGQAAAETFVELLNELADGKPWNTIGAETETPL
jgi:hypothetical protein